MYIVNIGDLLVTLTCVSHLSCGVCRTRIRASACDGRPAVRFHTWAAGAHMTASICWCYRDGINCRGEERNEDLCVLRGQRVDRSGRVGRVGLHRSMLGFGGCLATVSQHLPWEPPFRSQPPTGLHASSFSLSLPLYFALSPSRLSSNIEHCVAINRRNDLQDEQKGWFRVGLTSK